MFSKNLKGFSLGANLSIKRFGINAQKSSKFNTQALAFAAKKKEASRTKSAGFVRKPKQNKDKNANESDDHSAGSRNPIYYKPKVDLQIQPITFEASIPEAENKIFSINPELCKKLGEKDLPGTLSETFDIVGNPGLVFRTITRVSVEKILESSMVPQKKSLILDGEAGSGKSVALLQTVTCALNSDWFVIYASNTNSWVDSSLPYIPTPSNPNKFYQWTLVSSLLQQIKAINNIDVMRNKLRITSEKTLGKQKLASGSSILDVIDIGIKTPSLSQDAFNIVLETIESQTDVPVMIAVDQINTFYSKALYTDQKHNNIDSSQLLLVESILPYFGILNTKEHGDQIVPSKTLARGIAIGATSKTDSRFVSQSLNKALNENQNKGCNVLKVSPFNPKETSTLLEHYRASSLLSADPTDHSVLRMWAMTSGNPLKIHRKCTRFF
ncbi:hypothetical protein BB559_000016 [Furculomyces boomerangus]|uniref:Small ribosomal subunit protein mS29 n=2 Tax=Harpellales TaxID=61421 RepID=A0A2T9Z6J9_9FUNG|nr:hypothetical protein BB559_000638 [Furculomyces boomerangus]PVV00218.1 hypothetical protein BB559_000016 [Furculomyces boomerangus]PWA03527.1 hypothetical protein BB558_000332 [Smittium angustum]PWA03725.1 hypothetical protein BB558_000113 [Smittium angustum]